MIQIKKHFFRIICTIVLLFNTNFSYAQDYERLIRAIGMVESRLNDNAKNGKHAGFLQISEIALKDCNRINKILGDTIRYELNDRYDHEKAIEIFYTIQRFYNPKHDFHYAILLWNEGCSAMKKSKRQTVYYRKVMKYYKEFEYDDQK